MSEDNEKAFAALNAEIDRRGKCTFGWLWPIANEALGHPMLNNNAPGYRLTDRFLQRERRAGRLKCQSGKGGYVWFRPTPNTSSRSGE